MPGLRYFLLLLVSILYLQAQEPEQSLNPRSEVLLSEDWKGLVIEETHEANAASPANSRDQFFSKGIISQSVISEHPPQAARDFDDSLWTPLSVPHNWDQYNGFTGRKHGNLHGSAWYRRTFKVSEKAAGRRIFIFFEGVGSFAEIWVNGQSVGVHAGGLTCCSFDITDFVRPGATNILAVRASHPSGIRDLPWVCGGCERAYGFSEGSQPFGIHRPVRIIITDTVRIRPFGVHIWNDSTASEKGATAFLRTELSSMALKSRRLILRQSLISPVGIVAGTTQSELEIAPGASPAPIQAKIVLYEVSLWNPGAPVLYTLRTELLDATTGALVDALETPFGFRVISWPPPDAGDTNASSTQKASASAQRRTLLVNGKPVFLNGTCEYQHLLGGSHAFSSEMIQARISQITEAGFNAFRDAHHPHDLRYNAAWDSKGLVWWTQFGAHIWFDRPDFKANFKRLLVEWVRERRNSPSLFIWGLQNESMLPEDFARECTALIRELDPTSPSQRLVTTCNGGKGTDWDVPQNWTGTYYGDPATYADDLRKQLLIGEYGSWRSLGLHDEDPASPTSGYSEELMNSLLGTKLSLARKAADSSIGHFQWIFSTHENPGRNSSARGEQIADAWSRLDRIGPANNKGLLTLWGEPLDAWYLYRTHSVPASTGPTVLIAGSTWPDRWTAPAQPHDLSIFSNCEEVELFNDLSGPALARLSRSSDGAPFLFRDIAPLTRVLHAVGRIGGRPVAQDTILLNHLPEAPLRAQALAGEYDSLAPHSGYTSILRVNCGGPAYTDSHGHRWEADRDWVPGASWGAQSWASAFPGLDPALGSIRRIHTPVTGTRDEPLYQDFRYGRTALVERFALPDGDYLVDLHFTEPWYGRGGVDARGWRLFDVALNGQTRLRDLDIYAEVGFGHALVKSLPITINNGLLEISFPRCSSYQAVLSAIEILSPDAKVAKASSSPRQIASAPLPTTIDAVPDDHLEHRFDTGRSLYSNSECIVASLPGELVGSDCLRPSSPSSPAQTLKLSFEADLYLALPLQPIHVNSAAPQPALPSPSALPSQWAPTGDTLTCSGPGPHVFKLWIRHVLAGETVSSGDLPPGAPLFLRRTIPSPEAQSLTELKISHSLSPSSWQTFARLQSGARPHGPSAPGLNPLPQELGDADWVQTPPIEPDPGLSVTLRATDHVELFIALDDRLPPPAWLYEFTPHPGKIALGGRPLRLLRKRINQGDTIVLGANPPLPDGSPAPMYCVFARLARPVTTFSASQATPISAPLNSTSSASVNAQLPLPSPEAPLQTCPGQLNKPGDALVWRFDVGVGDRYFLVPQIIAPTSSGPKSVLRAEFLDREGNVLCESLHEILLNDRPGQLHIRSCTSINAGTYHARFTLISGPPLLLRSLSIE